MNADLSLYENPERLAGEVAQRWIDELAHRTFQLPLSVALSGGRIASPFLAAIAARAVGRPELLARVQFFWADERCVPPDHPESNYFLARENLFRPLGIDPARIHRIPGEIEPSVGAMQAEAELYRLAAINAEGFPTLDYIFLGMGEDGHVASLFPGVQVAAGRSAYSAVKGSKLPPWRITLTYDVLQTAKEVWVLASGPGKASALRESLSPHGLTPLARVIAARSLTRIFTDIQGVR